MTAFFLCAEFPAGDAPSFDWYCEEGAWADADASGVAVGIAGRLSNGDELAQSLGLPSDCPCAHIVRQGWLRWGRDLADRLRGPFVVAVMDRRKRCFFLARDALGVVPLCYSFLHGKLFASEGSRKIRSMTGKHHDVDRASLANFIAGGEGDKSHTYFEGISRLPPGHWLELGQHAFEISAYWTPARAPDIDGDVPELADRFAMLFDKAVGEAYIPSKTGLMLSGGLDSSMIAGSLSKVIGAGSDVKAVSMTYRQTSGWHDAPHLDALRTALPFTFADVPCDMHDPLSNLSDQLVALDGPWFSYGHSVTLHTMRRLAQEGFSVILNGHAGDEVVGYGFGRLNELALAGRWYSLWRLAPIVAALRHESRWDVFSYYLGHLRPIREVRQRWRRLKSFKASGAGHQGLLNDDAQRLVHDSFGPSPGLAIQNRSHDERMLHEANLSSPLQARAFEVFSHASRAIGVETRMPFADRDLVEFSLGLPSRTKLGSGFTRYILREAMRGRVPESVRLRGDKFDFGPAFVTGLMKNPASIREKLAQTQGRLGDLINPESYNNLQAQVTVLGAQIGIQAAMDIWRLIVADMWLRSADRDQQGGMQPHFII